ncbi:PilW family protein [Microbulbifer thermotolerans]|uniref:PilW family protein n=1 Tax=Microbulbifer thermotolerans TaxID=252514 RepID=UPI00224B8491|nr:PilW family protein [Microbulbifer thermotolerans]MCX2780249.1 PilW family protein [Microbulbifer thermotolerans]MCX2805797.1 PilW family protein [Microbulbifer thermotolerans]MCX2842704.1 PilW family protein [Microbulbifer thermotolerans]
MQLFGRQRGLSLIELMIGILLSSLLLLGVLQIFQSNSDTMRMQTAFSRVQESGRFAIDLLSKEIRSADYWGCVSDVASIDNHLNVSSGFLASIGADGVQGIDNADSSEKVDSIDVVDGTDILILSGTMDACGGVGRLVDTSVPGELKVTSNCPITAGQVVLVSNCLAADALTITGVSGTPGGGSDRVIAHAAGSVKSGWIENTSDTLAMSYGADSRLLLPYQRTFFIAKSTAGTNSLFMREVTGSSDVTQEIVPGIEDMQVSYGRDTTGNGIVDTWQDASSNLNVMAGVTAIKLQLLVASEGNAGAGEQKITELDGIETIYSDGRLRKLYVATVKVRNRGVM